jgi:hypothetical protein
MFYIKETERLLEKEPAAALDQWLILAVRELDEAGVKELPLNTTVKIANVIFDLIKKDGPVDLIGAADNAEFPRGPITAALNEALLAARHVAKRHKLKTEKIERQIRSLAAFQIRHQWRETDTYYLAKPEKAVGGFRVSIIDDGIRIDFVQHNILSLLGTRELLREK